MENNTPKSNKHTEPLKLNTSDVASNNSNKLDHTNRDYAGLDEAMNNMKSSLDAFTEGLKRIGDGLQDLESGGKKVAEFHEWQQKREKEAKEKELYDKLEAARKGPSKEDVVNMYIILTDEKKLGELDRSPEEFYDRYKGVFVVYSKEETLAKREEMMRRLDDEASCKEYIDEFLKRSLEERVNMTTHVLRVEAGTEDLIANAEWAINNTKEWFAPAEQAGVKLLVEKELKSLKEGLDEQFLRIEPNWMSFSTAKKDLTITVSDDTLGPNDYSNFQITEEGHLVKVELATKGYYVISTPVMNIFTFYWGVSAKEIWEEALKNGVRDKRESPIESDHLVQSAVEDVFSMLNKQTEAIRAYRRGHRMFTSFPNNS